MELNELKQLHWPLLQTDDLASHLPVTDVWKSVVIWSTFNAWDSDMASWGQLPFIVV